MSDKIHNSLTDRKLLIELIESEKLSDDESEAFANMLTILKSDKSKKLTSSQRDWAEEVHARFNLDPGAANLVSTGKVKVTDAQREELKQFIANAVGPKKLRPPGKK